MRQANTVHVENFDGLVALFTSIQPDTRRMAVLQTIADPKVTIDSGSWSSCLFAVATRAAARAKGRPDPKKVDTQIAATELGIPRRIVEEGYGVWDNGTNDERSNFRTRIRDFLREQEQAPVPEVRPQSTVRRLMASVRELVGVK